jgi:hypothetical protein
MHSHMSNNLNTEALLNHGAAMVAAIHTNVCVYVYVCTYLCVCMTFSAFLCFCHTRLAVVSLQLSLIITQAR